MTALQKLGIEESFGVTEKGEVRHIAPSLTTSY